MSERRVWEEYPGETDEEFEERIALLRKEASR